MNPFRWLSTLLVTGSLVWCFVVDWRIWVTPVRYLHYSSAEPAPRYIYHSFSEVSGLGVEPLVIPIILVALATWAAWRQRTLLLGTLTLVFAAFSFITGFSIGAAYVPGVSALLVATLLSAVPHVIARARK
jgi:hypothetical protein